MNLTQLLGIVTFAVGGGLLCSELLLGHEFLITVADTERVPLRIFCMVALVIGGLAITLGLLEGKEPYQPGRRHGPMRKRGSGAL